MGSCSLFDIEIDGLSQEAGKLEEERRDGGTEGRRNGGTGGGRSAALEEHPDASGFEDRYA